MICSNCKKDVPKLSCNHRLCPDCLAKYKKEQRHKRWLRFKASAEYRSELQLQRSFRIISGGKPRKTKYKSSEIVLSYVQPDMRRNFTPQWYPDNLQCTGYPIYREEIK